MKFFFGKRSIKIDAVKVGFLRLGIGLMFRTRKTRPLIFEFKDDKRLSITGLFVFFDFIVVFLDDKNRVIEVRRMKPFEISYKPKSKFRKFLEIPVDKKYAKEIGFFVGKRKHLNIR